jgi:hypothetical protein
MLSENIVINAAITGVSYTPLLRKTLPLYRKENFAQALSAESAFLLEIDGNIFAVSAWVSPKRTRSYPYARVYNTLSHNWKKITVIPFIKDEGLDGDRDFIQWDTISLMSLLDINVIIAYYSKAEKNIRYAHKITQQTFDADFVYGQIYELLSYQSSALHWNIGQLNKIADVAALAKIHYEKISRETSVMLHSISGVDGRIKILLKGKNDFMRMSRHFSQSAQAREIQTIQPKEYIINGIKAKINITNYLGGTYYFTADEAIIDGEYIYIIEGKHTKSGATPSLDDIKDGLLKMILYTNLKDVSVGGKRYTPVPILKLTSGGVCRESPPEYSDDKNQIIAALTEEAKLNNFKLYLPWENFNA